MLAVYALMMAMAEAESYQWNPENVVVGTTRWVAEDTTGDTVGLARLTDACLMATPLSFENSRFEALRAYEQGFVKEGVGAGGCAIAAALYQNWGQPELLAAVEALLEQKSQLEKP
jgi:NaMN:DMB phosphoribosyltransferase